MRLGKIIWLKIAISLAIFCPVSVLAQSEAGQSGVAQDHAAQRIYFVNSTYVIQRSKIAQEIVQRLNARGDELKELDRKTTAELNAEEEELTQLRDTMPIAKFSPLAEAFDQKTIAARQNIDQLTTEANAATEEQFARLANMMRNEIARFTTELGEVTILNANDAFYINPEDDLTLVLVERLDAEYANNREQVENYIFAPIGGSTYLTDEVELDNNTATNNEEVISNEQ